MEASGCFEGRVAGALGLFRLLGEPLVQAGVLDRDRQLGGQCAHEGLLVLAQLPAALRIDGEQADQLLARAQRHAESAFDPELLERVADRRQASVVPVGNLDQAACASGAQCQLEQALPDADMWAGQTALGRSLEPLALLDEVDGGTLGAEQLTDAIDGRVERVGQRELGDRLAYDRQQGAGPLELLGQLAAPLARAQGMRCPDGEGCEIRQHRRVGRLGEDDLQRSERRLA